VNGLRRHSLDARDTAADNCVFAVSADWDAAQLVLEGLPTGAGGGASLVAVPGVEMVFDRADGRLSRLIADLAELEPSRPATAYVRTMFGDAAAARLRQARFVAIERIALRPEPGTTATLAALSRLARLRAARLTSPVPASPLWAVEAAQLVRQAGPPGRHCDGAYDAVIDMLTTRPLLASRPSAGSVPEAGQDRTDRAPGGWLDPALIPPGVFRHGLSPSSDLIVRDLGATLAVEALLADSADRQALGKCRVRLVDSDARRVLATARFRSRGQRARADLRVPAHLSAQGAYWLEVADDECRPVQGTRLRRARLALRWADAALRAEGRPAGLAPGLTSVQWAQMAAHAWDQCRAGWEAAGDPDRAYLAATRDVPPAPAFLAEEALRSPAVLGGRLDHYDYPPVVTG
jgi:hypothetical protein